MKNVTEQQSTGIRLTLGAKIKDLEFADNIALPSHTRAHMQQKSLRLNEIASTIGLKINLGKTKVMSNDPNKEAILISNQGGLKRLPMMLCTQLYYHRSLLM